MIKLKLTITSEEHPELYRQLLNVRDLRRRTHRLKSLATIGTMMEMVASGQFRFDGQQLVRSSTDVLPSSSESGASAITQSVASQLEEWDG